MAKTAKATSGGPGHHQGAIGKVAILYGTVQAISPDGTVRVLGPNSLVFADDQIITGSDGSVSIILDGTPPIHLDLGRMSQITLDEDVYGGPASAADASAEADKVQQALLAGEQPIEPEAPAAGGEASAGGGHPVVDNSLTGEEVTPDSGAETRGIEFAPLAPLERDSVDTSPEGGINDGAVDEDGLRKPFKGNPDGPEDHEATQRSTTGNLTYDFGDDGPDGTKPFEWSTTGLEDKHIKSHGHELLYEISPDGKTLTGYYMEGGPQYQGAEKGSISTQKVTVFTLELTDVTTGEYKFTLKRPLDHSESDTEDDIVYNFGYKLTDGDGSTGTGRLDMLIDDDSPEASRCREIQRVDEDDIWTPFSHGTSPNDGAWPDGSFTGNPWENKGGPADIWGDLRDLVRFGADGPADNPNTRGIDAFSLKNDTQSLVDMHLNSHGDNLHYSVTDTDHDGLNDTLTATAGEGKEARTVFELKLQPDGHYDFKLHDQLDHADPDESPVLKTRGDGETHLPPGPDKNIPLDFSSMIVAKDYDGDSITLPEKKFVINITDDVPTAGENATVNLDDETAMTTYAAPNMGGTDDYDGAVPAPNTTGTLAHSYGADGAGSTLLTGTDTLPAGFSSAITNGGKTLTISQMQNGQSVDVLKVTLSDTTSGNYTVEPLNPIFHPTAQVSEEERNFTIKYEVTDGDGDKVQSDLNIRVDDDTPTIDVASAITYTLDVTNYGETSAGYDNSFGYYIKDADGNPTTGFVVWDNVKDYTDGSIEITGYTPDQLGFFIIPNGSNTNPGLSSNTPVSFVNVGGNWQAFAGTTPLVGEGANVLFDVKALNSDGFDHVQDNEKPGNLNWEDINGGGDQDWNDVNIGVVWSSTLPELTTQDAETVGTAFDSDSESFVGAFQVSAAPGADGAASQLTTYSLNVTNADSGLTSDGVPIILSMAGDDVVGKAGGNEIFRISVDASGNVTLKQSAEIDHFDENADGNAYNNSANKISLADGKISLTATAMITDGDGDQAGDSQILDISGAFKFEDDTPTAGENAMVNLDDETALVTYAAPNMGGTDDYDGAVPAPNTTGTLAHSYGADGAGSTLLTGTDTLPAGFSSAITNGGTTLTISQMQNGQFVDVLQVTLSDTTSGNYLVDQLNPIFHPTAQVSEEERNFTIKYEVTDGDGDKVESDLNIRIDDDTPEAGNVFNEAQEGSAQNTNLMIILDLSGSMDNDPDGSGGFASRLNVAKDALAKLIADYDALGDVMVRIVTFSSSSDPNGVNAAWMTATDALNYINGLNDDAGSGNTDYDAAIAAAQTAFASSGKIPDGKNVAYFLSDGEPNETNGTGSIGIVGTEETSWQNFLKANDIVSYALGMGSGADISELKPIAYNGVTELNDDANLAVVVDDITDLPDVLSGTVGGSTMGNLLTDSHFGADGPGALKIVSISHDADGNPGTPDVVYNTSSPGYDAATKILTVTTHLGGSLTVNFATGDYSYKAPNVTDDSQEMFGFTIQDADGDPASAKLTIDVIAADDAPTAKDNYAAGDEGTAGETANLVLVIDSSGSIDPSELNLMKAAVTHLINDYGSNLVNVMLVDFDDSARVLKSGGQVWMTGDQAIAKLSSIGSDGETDYDSAIAAVQNGYGTPPDADNTFVYFLSDGEPTGSDPYFNNIFDWGFNPNEISTSERTAWTNFLEVKGIDEVYAVGVGMGSGGEAALNTVAWSRTGNQADNVFEIKSYDDLDATLTGTVPKPVTGNVITDNDTLGGGADEPGADGWDSPNLLVSVEYNGSIHNFIDADDSVTFNLLNSGGKVTIEGDGDYIFTPGTDVTGDKTDIVKYTIEDSNHTTDSADLILTTNDLDNLVGGGDEN